MQQAVIASVDGSDKDDRAVVAATAIAKLADADLHVIRVIAVPTESVVAQAATIGIDKALVTGRREAQAQLADLVAGVTLRADHRVTFDVLEANDVVEAIIGQAVQHNARAVVMATRAPSAVGRVMVGSVADRVVRESPRPVVVVPPGAAFRRGREVQFARVLVPQDGSSLAFRCIEYLIELPHAKELEYVLIEVAHSEENLAEAATRLKQTAVWLRSRGVRSVETVIADASDAAAAIIGAVREVLPDIIAMSTRGSSGLGRLILGSVAEGVVRGSELPVLLLTPKVLAEWPGDKESAQNTYPALPN
jgi:nucleotide-binding universal stress UspA family protein